MIYNTDDPRLKRDGSSGAIINTDNTAFLAYRQQRNSRLENESLKKELAELKSKFNDILSLIQQTQEK